jgi:hypothetical protein
VNVLNVIVSGLGALMKSPGKIWNQGCWHLNGFELMLDLMVEIIRGLPGFGVL